MTKDSHSLALAFGDKTRVALVSSHHALAQLVIYVLEFNQKSISYQFEGQALVQSPGSDFVLIETPDLSKAGDLEPNIALLTTSVNLKQHQALTSHIVNGGILVYPATNSELDTELKSAPSFFRKIPYELASIESQQLNTPLGLIPLSFQDPSLSENLEGIQHLLQHLGIMEDEFYEALIAFNLQN